MAAKVGAILTCQRCLRRNKTSVLMSRLDTVAAIKGFNNEAFTVINKSGETAISTKCPVCNSPILVELDDNV